MKPRWCLLVCLLLSCDAAIGGHDGAVGDAADAPRDLAAGADLASLCGAPQCQPGATCQTGQGCCSCGPFARACLPGWTCAVPASNDARCPGSEPGELSACTLPDGVSCWYCASGAPHLAQCVSSALWSECLARGTARCWSLAGPTATCD